MGKLFVQDFHGTLEKGNEGAVLEATNETLRSSGYARRMTEAEGELLYGRRWTEYYAFLLPGESAERCAELALISRDMIRSNPDILARHIKPNDHAFEVLERIAASPQHVQIVVSNTTPFGIQMFLRAVGMQRFFPDGHAFGIVHPSYTSSMKKTEVLKEFVAGRRFDAVVATGDSPADLVGTVNYLYAHPGRAFRECDAHYRIRDLRELLREI